jgi:PAS domain S-box-containing protein
MVLVSDPASPDLGSIRFRRLQFGALSLGILVILAFAGTSAHDAWRAYHDVLETTDRELTNTAHALAEQTVWSLQGVDLLLLDTARWYRSESRSLSPEGLTAALAARAAGVPQVRQVTIMDSLGNPLYRSRQIAAPNFNIADRSYFIAQRDDPGAGLFMSEPLTTRTEGRVAVILSRRLDDEQGHFAGVVVANVDLQDLNQFYRAVDVGAGSAIQLLRDDGTLLVRNPQLASLVGHKFPALAIADTPSMAEVVDPIDGRTAYLATASVRNAPLRLAVTRDAAVALQPWRDETIRLGALTLLVSLLSALSLTVMLYQIRRVASGQRALRESEERYALAMEGANEGHWDWDARTDQLFLSPRMRALDGEGAGNVPTSGLAWRESVPMHPEDRACFETAVREHFAGIRPRFECEFRVRHANGDWRWLLARGRCFFDSAGKPARFVGSAIDVTLQKQAQLDKEQLEAQLRQSQKMEAIGTLAGGIAHDFNNVLGAILGYGELALQHAGGDASLRRYLDNVLHAAERARLLVERILGFSRSGLGDRVPVDVQSVVEETLELLAASLPSGIRIDAELTAGAAAVMGDPTYLHQVTMNLCTNAVQAMEAGGVLTVRLVRTDLGQPLHLTRGKLEPGTYLRLTVADSGAGIAPDLLERIFDPFFTTKRVGEGTGLGLSVVHGIVTDLGGAIEVRSTPGQGTRFDIWLPVTGEVDVVTAEPAEKLPQGRGETLMIVDDERSLVALAEEIVASLGYEPVGFESSRAALAAFRSTPDRFDAVLTDQTMPDLNGLGLVSRIRELRPSMPVILMSGHDDAELHDRAQSVGVREVLRKPLRGRDIALALGRLFASDP